MMMMMMHLVSETIDVRNNKHEFANKNHKNMCFHFYKKNIKKHA